MLMHYEKWYSPALRRDMEIKVYGRGGKPVLYIPCQDGRFFDFENFGMIDAWAPFIESGRATVFSVDTIDSETWSNTDGDPYWRIRRHEEWMRYLSGEVVPYIREVCRGYGWQSDPGILAFGCSLGAMHAANLYFHYPEAFESCLRSAASTTRNTASAATWTRRSISTPRCITFPTCRMTTRSSLCTALIARSSAWGRVPGS